MIAPPLPPDEAARLAALRAYRVLDTPPEPAFDDLTELAAMILDVPIALISLVDDDRQWFKSKVGLDADSTARSISFCGHAILDTEVFIVSDTSTDARFRDNPLVVADPKIRAYAGAPLRTPDGYRLGTLCTIDRRPREISPAQARQLEILARQVVMQLELRQHTRVLEAITRTQAGLVEALQMQKHDLELAITAASHDLRGPLSRMRRLADHCLEHLVPEDPQLVEALQRISSNGARLTHLVDQSLTIDAGPRDAVDLADVVREVTNDLKSEASAHGVRIELDIDEPNAVSIAGPRIRLFQIVHNLIANAIKYSHPQRESFVTVELRHDEERPVLVVRDNGLGIPEHAQNRVFDRYQRFHPDVAPGTGLGLAIVKHHVDDFGATIDMTSNDAGTTFAITFPRRDHEAAA